MKHLLCRLIGHRFTVEDLSKRHCARCRREEWLMSRPYPRIGEAKYYWKHMPFDELRF